MEATTLTPTQQHLLKLFFQEKLDKEADRLWEEGILDQQQLDRMRHEDLHKK